MTTWPRRQVTQWAGNLRVYAVGRAISLCFAATVLAPLGCAHAQDTDNSLRLYAVHIIRHPPEPWTGYGVYLGKGLVITAAHVVGWASRTNPSVRIAGLELPAQAIKEGSLHWGVDLTLLAIDEQNFRSACACAACRSAKRLRGSGTRSSSQFLNAQRARGSCRRSCFRRTSERNFLQ